MSVRYINVPPNGWSGNTLDLPRYGEDEDGNSIDDDVDPVDMLISDRMDDD